MKFFDNIIKNKGRSIIMYTSETWPDCIEAKRFFADNQIDVTYKDIADKQNKNELRFKYQLMVVPTIIIGTKVVVGFADNRDEIIELLKMMK